MEPKQKWILIDMKKAIILIIYFLLIPLLAKSQDIEGIPLGSVLSEDLIKEKLGKYHSRKEYVRNHYLKETVYVFGRDSLFFDCNNRLVKARLSTRRFSIDKKSIPGGYHIGDRFSEEKIKRCGSITKSDFYKNTIFIKDEEEFCILECMQLRNNRISSVLIDFPYGDDIEGVGVFESVPQEVIEEKFGVPYKIEEYDIWGMPAFKYVYKDNGIESYLYFSGQGRFLQFQIYSPIFKTFTNTIPSGLSVGDNIEKASALFDDEGNPKFFDDVLRYFVDVADGKITSIQLWLND